MRDKPNLQASYLYYFEEKEIKFMRKEKIGELTNIGVSEYCT